MQKLKPNFESEVPEDTNYFIKQKVEKYETRPTITLKIIINYQFYLLGLLIPIISFGGFAITILTNISKYDLFQSFLLLLFLKVLD